MKAKPFIKWAGGKRQLLPEIEKRIPYGKDESFTYVEPFVGGGAVLFHVLANYPNARVIINDSNTDLMLVYSVIKKYLRELSQELDHMQKTYTDMSDDRRKKYYYRMRDEYNQKQGGSIWQAVLFIFLNKTCFNGLYRVNSKGGFNVSMGSYVNPCIYDEDNLKECHKALQDVTICSSDFSAMLDYSTDKSFYYLDPPYKPSSNTASFNEYVKSGFNDIQQVALKEFCDVLNNKSKWLLSNSDLQNKDPSNTYFQDLYKGYTIEKVYAKRSINSKGNSRGKITELMINNYRRNNV